MLRWPLRWALLVLVALPLVFMGALAAILYLPALDDTRRRVAVSLLEEALNREVTVAGPVEVILDGSLELSVRGVAPVVSSDKQRLEEVPVGVVRLTFPLDAMFRGEFSPSSLEVSDFHLIDDGAAVRPTADGVGRNVAGTVAAFLASPVVRHLTLKNVSYARRGDPSGWNGLLAIERVVFRSTEGQGTIAVDGKGSVNDVPIRLSGRLPDLGFLAGAGAGNISLSLSTQGLEAKLSGRLSSSDSVPALSTKVRLDVTSSSLGDVQEAFRFARVVEGKGHLAIELEGPLGALSASSVTLELDTAEGRVYRATGTVKDIWRFAGVDFDFTAAFPKANSAAQRSQFALDLKGVHGRLHGGIEQFIVDYLVFEMGLAEVELDEIGPIRIRQVVRDDSGRLGLRGIRLVQGPPQDPLLDLSGDLNDVLQLRDFSLDGKFKLSMAGILTGRPDAGDIGQLRGRIAVSDESGEPRLESLDAELGGTDLMQLVLRKVEARHDGEVVAMELNVPDLASLAEAIGRRASAGTRVALDGAIGGLAGVMNFHGAAVVGNSDIHGSIAMTSKNGIPEITGELTADVLYMSTLTQAMEVAELFAAREVEAVRLRDGIENELKVRLDIEASSIHGGDRAASGLHVGIGYEKRKLRIAPLDFRFLDGVVAATAIADLGASPRTFALDARLHRLSLEELLRELAAPPLATGVLEAKIAVSAEIADAQVSMHAMSGNVSVSVRGGKIANRIIDLAGQNIVEWLFTRSPDGSAPLICFVSDFEFDAGIGTVRKLVLETENAQLVGGGTIDLHKYQMALAFHPRAKRRELIDTAGPIEVNGPFSNPRVSVAAGAVVRRVVEETVLLPLHLLGHIAGADGRTPPDHRPCVFVKNNN